MRMQVSFYDSVGKYFYKFVPFYIQLKKDLKKIMLFSAFVLVKIKQISSKQSLIVKNYCSNVVVFIENRVK
jgi:hypothetical protein